MIQLDGVSRTFIREDGSTVHAVRDLSLEIERGESVALLGPSGCGKTTTLRLINRLIEPTSGRILVGGEDAAGVDPVTLRRRMGYVVQRGGLFPHMTVGRNVGLICELEGWTQDRIDDRVDELLTLVNLAPTDFRGQYPRQLSGGQRQRVGVARALALDPEILLMDEPFGALDPITRSGLQQEFLELERLVAKTIVTAPAPTPPTTPATTPPTPPAEAARSGAPGPAPRGTPPPASSPPAAGTPPGCSPGRAPAPPG